MSSNKPLCSVCNKPISTIICQGCKKNFCSNHSKEHRQELSTQLESIVLKHDQLKQNLTQCSENCKEHPLMQKIDQWETESLDKIREIAKNARKQLTEAITGYTTVITEDIAVLGREFATARAEDSFIEIDIENWMERLQQCTQDLSKPSSINVQEEISSTPFIQKLVVKINEKEFFERSTEKMSIEDDGQVIVAKTTGYSTARCHREYSSGKHRVRFQFEEKNSSNWICFGIVSKNATLQDISYTTGTTYSWTTNSFVIADGAPLQGNHGYKSDIQKGDIIELFLDCDLHKIRLTNERTNKKHELDVDPDKCPFPWQLHFGLQHQNDRIQCLR